MMAAAVEAFSYFHSLSFLRISQCVFHSRAPTFSNRKIKHETAANERRLNFVALNSDQLEFELKYYYIAM